MEENRICILIEKAKTDNRYMEILISEYSPLIKKYGKKLVFMELSDAMQELTITFIKRVRKIKYCHSDGECTAYFNTALDFRVKDLCREKAKKIKELPCEYIEIFDHREKYADIITYVDIEESLKKLSPIYKKIYQFLLYDYGDKEIANKLSVSKQYVNRIKKNIWKGK